MSQSGSYALKVEQLIYLVIITIVIKSSSLVIVKLVVEPTFKSQFEACIIAVAIGPVKLLSNACWFIDCS